MLRKILPYLLIFILCLPVIIPLLKPGFFVTDDGDWMVIRLSAFHEALRTGQFPVRFLPRLNHSYGYPVLDFLYPLPFYAGEAIHLLGFGFVDSVKILFILSFLFSAAAMYLWISAKWGTAAGLVASLSYTYFPYRLFDVYKRGSLGEAIAFIFPPLIFFLLEKLLKTYRSYYLAWASLFLALLIMAHNIIAFLFLPIIILYVTVKCFQTPNSKLLIRSFLFLVLSLGLSAFFWLPALYDLQFTRAAQVQVSNFSDYFLTLNNFFSLLGFLVPLVFLISIIIAWRKPKKTILALLAITFLSIFFSTLISATVWQFSPLPRLVQFPWRFLSITAFSSSLLLACLVQKLKLIFVIPLVLLVLAIYFLWQPNIQSSFHPDSYYSTNDDTTTVKNEYMPKWVKNDPTHRPDNFLEIVSGRGRVVSGSKVIAQTKITIVANKVYFPGQAVLADNSELNVIPSANGLLTFSVPTGQHSIKTTFRETPVRLASDLLSLVSLAICLFLLIKKPNLV